MVGSFHRALLQVIIPKDNPLCGQITERKKRAVNQADDTHHIPNDLLVEILNTDSARARVKLVSQIC